MDKIIKAFKFIASICEDQNILSLLSQAHRKLSVSQESSHRRPICFVVSINSPILPSKYESNEK